jgi:hypothetical protein
MGAKKNRDLEIIDHNAKEKKELAKQMKKYKISDRKIAKIEAKQAKYEAWLIDVEQKPDY